MYKKITGNKRLLLVIITLLLSLMELMFAILYIIDKNEPAYIICLTSAVVYGIASLIISKTQKVAKYTFSLIMTVNVILLVGTFFNNTEGLTPLWLVLFPSYTFFFIGMKRGAILNGLVLLLLTCIFYLFPLIHANFPSLDFIFKYAQVYTDTFKTRMLMLYFLSSVSGLFIEFIKHVQENELELKASSFERLAIFDVLTGARNRATFDETLSDLCSKMKKENKPLCLIISDIDLFKKVNDNYGHQIGDQLLILIAKSFDKILGNEYPYFRWGGEEFLTILPDTTLEKSKELAEKLRIATSEIVYVTPSGDKVSVTLSLGVHQLNLDNLIYKEFAIADKCLYHAKFNGRNQTVSSDQLLTKIDS
jgi:diguanylate cyclase (GGDEF)-like protein